MAGYKFDEMENKTLQGWLLSSRLGEGKSAKVYRGQKGDQIRAVKVYDPALSRGDSRAGQLLRLKRQKDIGLHNHPNLVRIYDAGECPDTGLLYVVMDLYEGYEELTTPRIPRHRVPAILAQIADAARFLETAFQVVHRDIKPANIMIAPDHTHSVLLDLGVIKPVAPNVAATQDVDANAPFLGTFRYSPPEFLDGAVPENDLPAWRAVTFYQIGAVLYELLTSKRFFAEYEDRDWRGLDAAKRRGPPPLPKDHDGSPLWELVSTCLDPKPHKRMLEFKNPHGEQDWKRFQLQRLVLRPTVALLYTGGTFGSEPNEPRIPGEVRERQLRPVESRTHPYLSILKDRMEADFRKVYSPLDGIPFDLQWEILDPTEQLLSENATPGTWNALTLAIHQIILKYCVIPTQETTEAAKAVAELPRLFEGTKASAGGASPDWTGKEMERLLDDLRSRYLAGIIVFHGTDTMAYSANAIAFGTNHLPCPIVLTGANNPPSAEKVKERTILTSASDAWRNATQALHFLAAFGHRFTEVFVAFGGTIHHAINLRKVPLTSLIVARRSEEMSLDEPFVFRNQSVLADYMFKYVDGFYCNNFYPHNGQSYTFMVSRDYTDYKHRRWQWVPSGKPIGRDQFAEGVHFIKISPSMPAEMLTPRTRLLVVEGYSSGTVPTRDDAEFTALLVAARARGVPIVLISESGLLPTRERYHEENEENVGRMIRLFGITRESAVPLLARLMASIQKEWPNEGLDGPTLQDERAEVLLNELRHEFRERKNILASVLGHIADEQDQQTNLKEQLDRERKALDVATLIRRREDALRPAEVVLSDPAPPRGFVNIRRDDLLWLLVQVHAAFDAPGSGPEAPALVSDAGFVWGYQMMGRLLKSKPLTGPMRFVDREPPVRRALLDHVTECLSAIERMMANSGVVSVRLSPIVQKLRTDMRHKKWIAAISTGVVRTKERHYGREDERYAMQGWEPAESAWLMNLRVGVRLEEEPSDYEERIEKGFANLFQETWNRRAEVMDWFVLGLTRGMMAATLEHLRFDQWVSECESQGDRGRALLRQSIMLEVPTCSRDLLEVKVTYERRFAPEELPRLWPAEEPEVETGTAE